MVFSVSTILSYTTANRVVERPEIPEIPEIPDSFRTHFPLAPEHPSTFDKKKRGFSRKLFGVKHSWNSNERAVDIVTNEITLEIILKKIYRSARRGT